MTPKSREKKDSFRSVEWPFARFILFLAIFSMSLAGCKKNTDTIDSYVYLYGVTETWPENNKTNSKPIFYMQVYKSWQNSSNWLLFNFGDYGSGVLVEAVVNNDLITIPQQKLSNSRSVVGSGSLDSQYTMTFTYTESYNGISNTISTIAKRK